MAKKKNPVVNSTFAALKDLVEKELANRAESLPDVPEVSVNIKQPAPPPENMQVGTTGQYRGAPAGVDTPKKLKEMRGSLDAMLDEGVVGRNWYDQSSQSVRDLTGNRPGLAQRYGLLNALTSQGASVPTNQGFAVKGYNQLVTGNPVVSGRFPGKVAEGLEQIPSGTVNMGPKVGPFYEAVTVPEGGSASRPTNDIWMARAFGYTQPDGSAWDAGLSPSQHRFMDDEMGLAVQRANERQSGGATNWNPEKSQASIWTAIKSRTEGTPVEDAAYDFSSGLDRVTGNINVESEPAMGLGHFANIRGVPGAAEAMQYAQRSALSDSQGRDLVSLYASGLTRPTETGYGYYKGYSAPTDVVRVLAAPGTGSNTLDPASAGLLDAISAGHGLLRGQESVGNNFFRTTGIKAGERNAAQVDIGESLAPEQMTKLGSVLDQSFGGAVFPVNTGTGVRLMTDPDGISEWAKSQGLDPSDNKKVSSAWQKELTKIVKSEFDQNPTWGLTSGNLVGSFEQYTPSAYLKSIDESGVSQGIDMAMRALAPKLEKADQLIADAYPDIGTRSNVMKLVRETLGQEGLDGVRRLVEAGIVPVALLGVLAQDESGHTPRQSPETHGLISEF